MHGARRAVTGEVDVDEALARRNWMTGDWDDKGQVQWLDGVGVTLFRGHGRLSGRRTVEVESPDGTRQELSAARAVVVATGSSAVIPPIEGLRDIRIWDSRDATSAKQVPERLLILGGGVVGVEMAQAWRSLGAREVTVVEAADRLVPNEEPFAGEQIRDAFEREGIDVITGVPMTKARRDGVDGPVTATLKDGRTLTGDEILVAVGCRSKTGDVGLDTVGLEPGRPIEVDEQLRATGVGGRWLYAIGDANGRALLTHMGKYQARLASDHILGERVEAWADHRAVPRVIFTDPQVAAVGLTERQTREQGIDVRVVAIGTEEVSASSVHGEGISGTCQIVVDERRGVIVGATFTGPEIGELIHAATIAIVGDVTMKRLRHAVPSFPTLSEVWLKLVEAYGSDDKRGRGESTSTEKRTSTSKSEKKGTSKRGGRR